MNYSFEPGDYNIKGLFWECEIDNKKKKVNIINKFEICEFVLTIDEKSSYLKLIKKSVEIINDNLSFFLNKRKIKKWLPARTLTWDFNNNIFEICYYHDIKMHDIMYEFYPKYVIQPIQEIVDKLDYFYEGYGLDFNDELVYGTKKE